MQTTLQPKTETAGITTEGASLEDRLKEMEQKIAEISARTPQDKVSIILFSGDFDKAIAAFFMANGAASMGMDVTMYFTFWGCSVIKRRRTLKGKRFLHKMVNLMLPGNSRELAPSRMSYGGIGRKLFNYLMKGKMSSLEEQIELALEAGVKFQVCSPSLAVMGFDEDISEYVVPIEICGVAAMYDIALDSRTAYFVS